MQNLTTKKLLIQKFGKKSNTKAIRSLTLNWFFFLLLLISSYQALVILPAPWNVIAYIVVSFLIACALRGFDNLTHEASHNNIFSQPRLNKTLQFFYSFPVFKTVTDYAYWHTRHHKFYIKDRDNDPDTRQSIRWGVEDGDATNKYRVWWFYVGRLLCFYYLIDNIRYNLIPHLTSTNARLERILFWIAIIIIIAVTGTWNYFLLGYLIPYLFWLPYIRFVTESTKHTNVNLEDQFANSRNNIGWFQQLVLHPHNDGFHQMHHFAPSIPFYNLKKAYIYLKSLPGMSERFIESKTLFQTIKQIYKHHETSNN